MARPLFIVGCQRSGTTALHDAIGCSPEVHARGEGDPAAMSSEHRLLSQRTIDDLLASEPLPILAL